MYKFNEFKGQENTKIESKNVVKFLAQFVLVVTFVLGKKMKDVQVNNYVNVFDFIYFILCIKASPNLTISMNLVYNLNICQCNLFLVNKVLRGILVIGFIELMDSGSSTK